MDKIPLVSVIITTKNESKNIGMCLESIVKNLYANKEIIVVDNSSTDNTQDLAKKYTNKVFNKGPERSAQRNFGALKSHGKYLLFLDADMELSPSVISDCVQTALKDSLGGVIIPEKSVGEGFWSQVKAEERSWYIGDNDIEAERFFDKNIFEKAGRYDLSITGPEDWDLPNRTRKLANFGRIKSLIIHHEGRQALFKMARKKYYYALKLSSYLKKNHQSAIGPGQIYLLRSSVAKNIFCIWRNPPIYLGIWIMFLVQTFYGVVGFLVGKMSRQTKSSQQIGK